MPRVFVSSTFKDMHLERDALKSKLTPILNSKLGNEGDNVDFVDLRWGINTSDLESEESNKKVLRVCLDEIDDSKPYMIVFIGNRYGWIPPSSLIDEALASKDIKDIPNDISITNLEIEYGALRKDLSKRKVLFYFRKINNLCDMSDEEKNIYDVESPLHQQKLDALKARIEQLYPNRVRHYELTYDKETHSLKGSEKLVEMLNKDLNDMLDNDLQIFMNLPEYKKMEKQFVKCFEKYENSYATKEVAPIKMNNKIFNEEFINVPHFVAITGENGSGRKTTLALKYQQSLKEKDVINVCYVHELGEITSTLDDFVYYVAAKLNEINGEDVSKFDKNRNVGIREFSDVFDKASLTYKKVRFFIMNANDEMVSFLRANEYLTNINKSIAFYLEFDELNQRTLPYSGLNQTIKMKGLNKKEIDGVINNILKKRHKQLPLSVIEEIKKKKGSTSPLYISLMIDRLLMFNASDYQAIKNLGDGMNAIENYMVKTVKEAGDDLKGLSKNILLAVIDLINDPMIPKLIGIMSNACMDDNTGIELNKNELISLFEYKGWQFNELSYVLFLRLVPALFNAGSSALSFDFACNDIREAAREVVNGNNCLDDIIDWLENGDIDDNNYYFTRSRLPYLYLENNDLDSFLNGYIKALNNDASDLTALTDKYKGTSSLEFAAQSFQVYMSALIINISKRYELALEMHKRVIEMAKNEAFDISSPLIPYIFMYIDLSNGVDDGKRRKDMTSHAIKVLDLYCSEYKANPDNELIHALFCAVFSQFNLVSSNGMVLDLTIEERNIFNDVVKEVQTMEHVAFAQELYSKNLAYASACSITGIVGTYNVFRNKRDDPTYAPMIKQELNQAISMFMMMGLEDEIEEGITDSISAQKFSMYACYLSLHLLMNGDEIDNCDDLFELIKKIVNELYSYFCSSMVDWILGILVTESVLLAIVLNLLVELANEYVDYFEDDWVEDIRLRYFIFFAICSSEQNSNYIKTLFTACQYQIFEMDHIDFIIIHDYVLKLINESSDLYMLMQISIVFFSVIIPSFDYLNLDISYYYEEFKKCIVRMIKIFKNNNMGIDSELLYTLATVVNEYVQANECDKQTLIELADLIEETSNGDIEKDDFIDMYNEMNEDEDDDDEDENVDLEGLLGKY